MNDRTPSRDQSRLRGGQVPLMTPPPPMRVAVTLTYAGAVTSLLLAATIAVYRDQMIADAGGRLVDGLVSRSPVGAAGGTAEQAGSLGIALGIGALVVLAGVWVLMARVVRQGRSGARAWASGLGVLNLLLVVSRLAQEGGSYPWNAAMWALSGAITLVILALLWQPVSSAFLDDHHRQVYARPTPSR